jgi:hypothetical protein
MHVLSVVTIRERERVLNLPETTPNLIFWQLWGLSESELLSAGWCAVTTSVPPNPSQNSNATPTSMSDKYACASCDSCEAVASEILPTEAC